MGAFSRFFMAQEVFVKYGHCGETTVEVNVASTLTVPVVLKDGEQVSLVELMDRGYGEETVEVNCGGCNQVIGVLY
jgi:hypothetical protein